jgi:hypothetical protein
MLGGFFKLRFKPSLSWFFPFIKSNLAKLNVFLKGSLLTERFASTSSFHLYSLPQSLNLFFVPFVQSNLLVEEKKECLFHL